MRTVSLELLSVKLLPMTCSVGAVTLALLLGNAGMAVAQIAAEPPPLITSLPSSLDLPPEKVSHLQAEVSSRDYVAAEKLLLAEIEPNPHTPRAGRLLAYLGSIYFLNSDYLNAAIAWKKSEAIAPLSSPLQLSLAMAYIRIAHPDWARPVLESLSAHDSKNALYPYWLGRLDYDAQRYAEAAQRFQQAIALDPSMARAYDNLGLCYFSQNQTEPAIQNFKKAIELDRAAPQPSPWPYINLAQTLEFLGRTPEAETNLRRALELDPKQAATHYQLGKVLEHLDQSETAVSELQQAIKLDANYAEPHIVLANIYRRMGRVKAANEEVRIYSQLHASAQNGR